MVNNNLSPEGTDRVMGRDAQRNNILAARVLAETVKTTLGPKGMDKMLVDNAGNIIVTNDGVTILSEMEIEHPAAKMLVEIAKTQEAEVGDGTTTAVMLAGKFLENAEKLLDQKIHPTIITRGYRLAAERALQILNTLAIEISTDEELSKIAQTAMTGKGAEYAKEKLSELLVQAVKIVANNGKVDLEDIKIEKRKGYSISDTKLISGIVIDKERVSQEMPQKVMNAKIALLDCALEIKTPERETRISISSPEQLQSFMNQEEQILQSMVNKVIDSGANVVVCQRGIDDVAQFYLAKQGVYAIRRVSRTDLQKLAKATGGKIISNLKELSGTELGFAEIVEEIRDGETGMTYITGCKNPKAITIVIRGGTDHVIDEVERALRDGLGDLASIVKDPKVVAGGGAIEIELARKLKEFSQTLRGREQLAVEQFALALEFIPTTLAENAGLDPLDILTDLKVSHEAGNKNHGLNLFNGKIEDTLSRGIIEPLRVKTQAISSASEVAIMILRIDDVIAARKPKSKSFNPSQMADYE
ncbi:TCP-1/cpn60 chaperonin family protein [Candidatus Pacearchaeota archaeon]|nr:TCP-1/cpn60 chaperonin family protein [Candidatus Pacearchaeota archaeon]